MRAPAPSSQPPASSASRAATCEVSPVSRCRRQPMVVDFNLLWNRARSAATSDEAESVRIMADILSSKEGRRFITSLELPEAELCIEILDYVQISPSSSSKLLADATI